MPVELPYVRDIREQPAAIGRLLAAGLPAEVTRLLARLDGFDRVVMTGMGASLFGAYPAFLCLASAGVPVWLLETSELLGGAQGLMTSKSLLWVTSQSGDSGEIAALLDRLPTPSPVVFGITNSENGQLARDADVVLPLHSGDEHAVGTKSYVTTLVAHELAAAAALGGPTPPALGAVPERLAAYLEELDTHVIELGAAIPEPNLFLVGRGASLATAQTGALIVKEAAKVAVEGMSAPQFRHGPLEMVEPGVAVVVFAGMPADVRRNRQTLTDVRRLGGNGVWIGADHDRPGHLLPDLGALAALQVAEIVPIQLLSIALARRRGVEPGAFRHIDKVTRTL